MTQPAWRLAGKSAEQLFHEFRGNTLADVTMSMLRLRHALVHLALMAAHLGDGQIVDGQSLVAAMDADLLALLRGDMSTGDRDIEDVVWDADELLTRWTNRVGCIAAWIRPVASSGIS